MISLVVFFSCQEKSKCIYECTFDRFFDVVKFTILTPLSLLISCNLSFPIVSLKIFSVFTFALKSYNNIFELYFGN
jgi:hypothetical protein